MQGTTELSSSPTAAPGPSPAPAPAPAPAPSPASTRRARFDPVGSIHKAIRAQLSQALLRMGQASFDEPEAEALVLADLDEVLWYCELHAEHEERFVRPACEGRLSLETFDRGHPEQARRAAELRALARALSSAPEGRKAEAGRALYLHFASFVGETLLHMSEEEQLLLPLVHRVFTDDELVALHGRMVGSMSPADLRRSAAKMLPSVSRQERLSLVGGMAARAPREAVVSLLSSLRPSLSEAVFSELMALVDPA